MSESSDISKQAINAFASHDTKALSVSSPSVPSDQQGGALEHVSSG